MVNQTKQCEDCSKSLSGRSDKRFCNDHCRNNYHTKKNRDWNNYMRNINHILRRNRRILWQLYQSNKNVVSKDYLAMQGFQFTYCTSSENNSEERRYYDFLLKPYKHSEFLIEYIEEQKLLQTG